MSIPPDHGSHCSLRPKIKMNIIPTQKYGIALLMTSSGGATLSMTPPRRHALMTPTPVPRMNARMVTTPNRPRVHGIAARTTCPTGEGKKNSDVPKFPLAMSPR